jgi:hypothetical protein
MKKQYIPQTPEQMRNEIPSKLLAAYLKMVEADFSEATHKKYDKLARIYLGKEALDSIARGKLVVKLCTATMDLINVKPNKQTKTKKEKPKKTV